MRELHGHHGEHRRHGRDAPALTDPAVRAHDGPKHAAQDAVKLSMLTDPTLRMAERLRYARKVEARNAEYAARHAKSQDGDQARAPERPRPQEPRPEHVSPESPDKPAGKIDARTKSPEHQEQKQGKPERSRLPKADTVQMVSGNIFAIATGAVALGLLPDSWEKVAAGIATAVIGNITWANRRWKDKHGNRPED
jgi:hypothetical protein